MTFSKDIYRALEDIVGSRNISDDPAVLVSYQFPLANTSIHLGPFYRTYTPRGAAVVLPGSTEQVQKIVKICNKYKVKYKASSTFWGAMGYPCHEDVVQLDMRRMDRILEIDQKNMFAVIEPHVIGVNLQAEAMRVGLNTHIIGAGGSCSPLASATSYAGPGPDSLFMGNGDENLLGAEWVMPDGEVIRTGSMGCGSGWFCGEGPGPGVKGLIRGMLAARGSMGVYTKCALRLYPWPGPASFPVEGIPPVYRAILPDNIKAYTLAFPSWESWANCAHRIWDVGIGYIAHRQFNLFGRDLKFAMIKILTDPNRTLSDLEQLVNDPEIKKVNENMTREFQFVLAGMTPRDTEWQEKALNEILAETGGWKVDAMSDPQIARWVLAYLVRLGHKNLNLVFAGGYEGCFGTVGPPDYGSAWVEETSELKKKWEERGSIVRAGGDCTMGGVGGLGGGAYIMWENFTCWDPHDRDSVEGTFEFFERTDQFAKERNLGRGMERTCVLCRGSDGKEVPEEVRDPLYAASPQAHVFRYQRKIREAFNPNDLGDSYYVTL
jgi:glycolate oxidase